MLPEPSLHPHLCFRNVDATSAVVAQDVAGNIFEASLPLVLGGSSLWPCDNSGFGSQLFPRNLRMQLIRSHVCPSPSLARVTSATTPCHRSQNWLLWQWCRYSWAARRDGPRPCPSIVRLLAVSFRSDLPPVVSPTALLWVRSPVLHRQRPEQSTVPSSCARPEWSPASEVDQPCSLGKITSPLSSPVKRG